MKSYAKTMQRKLLDTICQIREDLSKYTTDPKQDFTRNRKPPFETLCRTRLSMSRQSLNVELQRQFHYGRIHNNLKGKVFGKKKHSLKM